MASGALKVLCVHGVGHQDVDASWKQAWFRAIEDSVRAWNPRRKVETAFVAYDDLFVKAPLGAGDTVEALWKLLASGIVHGIGDFLRRPRGVLDLPANVRWTAGMIVQWVENDRLRAQARARVLDAVKTTDPEVVCAHSLGSLIAYDAFVRPPGTGALADRTFVTLGAQIGNAFVRGSFGGRLVPVRAQRWRHLFNRFDNVFTARLRIPDPSFEQIDTPFDIAGMADHDAIQYLRHPNAVNGVWREVAGGAAPRALERTVRAFARVTVKPVRRALLIGINQYPKRADRLEGCVNDVFLVSSILQDSGFRADDIRVVLDQRATAKGIRDRLEWLLDGVAAADQRVLYYSGHGAQIPAFGARDEVDHFDECLVPYDFDWTREHAITDDSFFDLYTQLPYGTHFMAIFDCCHSGGLTRDSGVRVRGLSPPDDIRHRTLKWESDLQMWVARDFQRVKSKTGYARGRADYTGASGISRRLGRSVLLRRLERSEYVRVRGELGHHGPYLPVILQACREDQLSYEYRHGVTSYGAFTYSLGEIFRRARQAGRRLSFRTLCARTAERLKQLEYDQTPVLIGPKKVVARTIPWQT